MKQWTEAEVDLREGPFFLSDHQIQWVESTLPSMTLDEKIGQLFIYLDRTHTPEHARYVVEKYHIGGLRWSGGGVKEICLQNQAYQTYSKIPLLMAANCEAGGNGAVQGGTMVANGAACAAASGVETAYRMGKISGKEAAAVGCNWTFAPLSDLLMNWRNTNVGLRAFDADPDRVIELCKAYMAGVRESGLACCTKHFPGDGTEERDQHLVMGCNDLSCEEYDRTFGHVYRALIEDQVEAFMVGHICQRAWSKRLNPSLTDENILPATLAPELLQGLLRNHLGFRGLIITDASHMAGLRCAAPREEQVIGAIAAGCDMFLFFNDPEEDLAFIKKGLSDGRISESRLENALRRILALKAKLNLHRRSLPDLSLEEAARIVGCAEHKAETVQAAERSITLVKDTQHLLPVDPQKYRRAMLYFIQSAPLSRLDGSDPAKKTVIQELERAGFQVDVYQDYYEMEMLRPAQANKAHLMDTPPVETFRRKYDIVFLVLHMRGNCQQSNIRLCWSGSHSAEMPWYIHEVPTIAISLSYPNLLYDIPAVKTYINAYSAHPAFIRAAVKKIVGKTPFWGTASPNVWCNQWETMR